MKVKLTEQVEFLPQRLGIRKNLNGKRHAYYDFGYYRHSLWNKEIIPKCAKIIESSVGLHVDDVFSKISKIIPKNFPYSNHEVFSFSINYDERKNEGVEIYRRYRKLYIDKQGIICEYIRPTNPHKYAYIYKEQQEKRKIQKQRDKIIAETLLKLVNNKLLFEFYSKLLKDEKAVMLSIKEFIQWRVDNVVRKKKDDWWYIYKTKNHLRAEKRLQQVKNDISKIENGEYNIFYESNVYLYSLQKECPHFEQVIKS